MLKILLLSGNDPLNWFQNQEIIAHPIKFGRFKNYPKISSLTKIRLQFHWLRAQNAQENSCTLKKEKEKLARKKLFRSYLEKNFIY